MPAAEHLCACNMPRGAGLYTGPGAFAPQLQVMTPDALLNQPEASYPIGSQAKLFAPFPADRGIWQQPRLVSVFVKTPNGRWTSYPGNDVSYPTLAALALAAPVQEVVTPGQGTPAAPEQSYSMATIPAAPMSEAEAAAQEIAQAAAPAPVAGRFNPLWLLAGAAALALLFFGRRR